MGMFDTESQGGEEGGMMFDDKSVRRGFIRKVYSILSVQVEEDNSILN